MVRDPKTLAEFLADRNPRFVGVPDMGDSREAWEIAFTVEEIGWKAAIADLKQMLRSLRSIKRDWGRLGG